MEGNWLRCQDRNEVTQKGDIMKRKLLLQRAATLCAALMRTIAREPVDSSDWSYQVQGGLEFQISRWFWAQAGWRYLKYDYKQEGFTNKTALNGPFIQGGVNF
jgi:hypothetical protein